MPSDKITITVTGKCATLARKAAKKLGISEDAAIRVALLFFVSSVNTPPKEKQSKKA